MSNQFNSTSNQSNSMSNQFNSTSNLFNSTSNQSSSMSNQFNSTSNLFNSGKSQETEDHKNANNFDLPNNIFNTLFHNVKECQSLQMMDNFPVPKLDKYLFFVHVNIKSVRKNFDALNDQIYFNFNISLILFAFRKLN